MIFVIFAFSTSNRMANIAMKDLLKISIVFLLSGNENRANNLRPTFFRDRRLFVLSKKAQHLLDAKPTASTLKFTLINVFFLYRSTWIIRGQLKMRECKMRYKQKCKGGKCGSR